MALTEPVNGIDGSITFGGNAIAQIQKFTINQRADNQVYATSSTGGFKETAEGNRSWDAVIDILMPNAELEPDASGAIEEGDIGAVVFTLTTGKTLTGNCIVDEIGDFEVDIEGSGMVGCSLRVTGIGDLS